MKKTALQVLTLASSNLKANIEPDMTESALIFRKTLLPYSETFVVNQGKFLPEMHAVYFGYKKKQPGFNLIEPYSHFILDEESSSRSLARARMSFKLGLNKNLKQKIQSYNPKVIHAHFGNNAYSALTLAKQLSIPHVATFHGYDITKTDAKASKKLQSVFSQSNRIIAVSQHIKQKLLEAGCKEDKITQHYIGIDTDFFNGKKSESAKPSILFVGRLTDKKGCHYLIEAFKLISKKIPDVQLNIVGDGPLLEPLKTQAKEYSGIQFLGIKNTNEIRQLLSNNWLFCTPSITAKSGDEEGLGMVFLEAQAMQTPAISFNTGGTVEAIAHEETGFNLPEKDIPALASTLETLINDHTLRKQMGLAGRERVLERFDIRKQCAILENIYRSC